MKRIVYMLRASVLFAMAMALLATGCKNVDQQYVDMPLPDPDNGGLTLPPGFSAFRVAEDLGRGRHLAVADNGDVFMALSNLKDGKGGVALRDTSGDGRADQIHYFGPLRGTGIRIRGNYLYFGSDTAIVRYPLPKGELIPGERYEIIAKGFVNNPQHSAKPFDFDDEGNMYVTVGAPANACMEQMRTKGSPGMDPCPILEYAGGIWRFNADQENQDQKIDGYRFSTGIRHAVALSWNPIAKKLYAVQHGRDQLHQFFPELYDEKEGSELPAEEFLLLTDGADYGWPYCYYDPFKSLKVLAPEYGGDGTITGRCDTKTDPIMGFPAHMAPNDLLFYTGDQFPEKYRGGAFIAFHGSWNRAPLPQKGYFVVFVPFDGDLPSGEWEVFADGFAGMNIINSPGDAMYRPVGLATGPDGSLYVSDSRNGTIWRIMYSGVDKVAATEQDDTAQVVENLSEHPGKIVYTRVCLPCHQADGSGVPGMHPPLAGSDLAQGDDDELIKIVLNGLRGEIEVKGEKYNGSMAPLSYLSDQEIADVLTYVRSNFGNSAPAIKPDEVASVRAAR